MYSLSLLLHIIAMRNGADPYKSNEFSIFSLLFIWIRLCDLQIILIGL